MGQGGQLLQPGQTEANHRNYHHPEQGQGLPETALVKVCGKNCDNQVQDRDAPHKDEKGLEAEGTSADAGKAHMRDL